MKIILSPNFPEYGEMKLKSNKKKLKMNSKVNKVHESTASEVGWTRHEKKPDNV